MSFILLFPAFQGHSPRGYARENIQAQEVEALFVAEKAFNDGFYEVSRELLERFLKNYPSSAYTGEVRLLIGQCYFRQNEFIGALDIFESLLKHPAGKEQKDAILYWIAEVHFKGNNFGRAADFYEKIIREFPDSSYLGASYYSLAWCRMEQGRFSESLDYLKIVEERYRDQPYFTDTPLKIIECLYHLHDHEQLKKQVRRYRSQYARDPYRRSYLYFYLGESEYYAGNYPDAVKAYRQVIRAETATRLISLSWLGIAWSRLKLKEHVRAADAFSKVRLQDRDKKNRDILKLGEAVLLAATQKTERAALLYEELARSASDPLVCVQAHLGRADILYEAGEYAQSAGVYRRALDTARTHGITGELTDNAHYGLAWASLKQGEFKRAIDAFQKIVRETDDKVVKVSALCQIGDAYTDAGDYEKAQEAYDEILREYPDSFYSDYVQYQLGMLALKRSNYDGAIMSFLTLQRNFPDSQLLDDASYALGLAYFQRRQYKTSREIFEEFRHRFRGSHLQPQALYLLGTSWYNQGEFEKALESFKNVIRFYGDDRGLVQKAEYEIADCYFQMGREKEALARFEQLRSKYPESSLTAEIMWWLGEYYYRLQDLEMARRYFLALIEDFPESSLVADAHYALGWGYAEELKHQEAIDSFREVIALGETGLAGQSAVAIADIYARKGRDQEALQVYAEIIERYPNLAGAVYPKMAQVHASRDDREEALALYRRGLDMVGVTEMAGIQFKIAQLLENQQRVEEAVQEYLKVTYLYAEDTDLAVRALLRVARIYENKEGFREAVSLYKRVVELDVAEAKFAQERIDSLVSSMN